MAFRNCRVCGIGFEKSDLKVNMRQHSCPPCQRKKRNARLASLRPPKPAFVFDDHVMPVPEAGCWLWTGPEAGGGYGNIPGGRRGKTYRAHRVSYERSYGPIPNGLCVCHKCDTPLCVNPNHLFLGTSADNSRDMWRKGRARPFGKPALPRLRA